MNKDQELIYEYQYLFFHQNDQDRFYSPYPKIEKCVDKMCDHCICEWTEKKTHSIKQKKSFKSSYNRKFYPLK